LTQFIIINSKFNYFKGHNILLHINHQISILTSTQILYTTLITFQSNYNIFKNLYSPNKIDFYYFL